MIFNNIILSAILDMMQIFLWNEKYKSNILNCNSIPEIFGNPTYAKKRQKNHMDFSFLLIQICASSNFRKTCVLNSGLNDFASHIRARPKSKS